MGKIDLQVTLDNSDFKRKMEESTNAIKNSGKTAEEIGKKVQDAINNYSLGAKELLDVARQNFKEQSQVVKQVGEDIEVMQAKLKRMSPSTAQQELTKDVIAAKQALKEETAILNEKKEALDKVSKAYKEHSNETNRTANKLVTLRTQTANAREELSRMEQDGLRGTEAYNKLQLKLGELTNQMNSTQKQARVLADDEKYLTATIQAISGIAGALSVAQGAVGLFGEKNEELQRIMLKVQSLMAITIGLEQVARVVHKNNAVSVLFLSKAQNALATSLGISAVAAKGLMIALTGGLSIGLMALMALYDKLKAKKEASKKATEELKEKEIEFYKSVGDTAAKNLTSILMLQEKYKDAKTLEEKNKFLKKHTKTYEELGVSVKNVKDQDNLLIANTDAYVRSVIAKAKADAYRAEITKKQSELIQLENKYVEYEVKYKTTKTNNMVFAGDAMVRSAETVRDNEATEKKKQEALEKRKKEREKIQEEIIKMAKNALKTEQEIESILKDADIKPVTEDKKQKDLKDISSYGKAITDMWQKIYQDIEQAKANSINNEFARTTELNTLNAKKELDELDKQIEIIKQKRIEQAKAEYVNNTGSEKGFVAPIITLTDEEQKVYEERAKQIIDNIYKLNQEAYDNLIGDYLTYEEKRDAIQKKYGDKRKDFEREGLTKNIEELNKIEQEELSELDNSFASKQKSFLSWLDNITKLTQKQLENQIKIAKKSIENGDLDEKTLAILRVKINELEAQLKEKKEELKDVDAKDLGFSNVIDKLSDERKKLREELAKGEEADSELVKAYKNNISELSNELYSRIDKVVGKIKLMSSFMKDFADATGEVGKGFSEVVGYADDFVDKIIAGAKAGGAWGAIAGAVVSIATSIMKSIQQTKEEKKELEENELDYQRELNQLYRERAELIAQANNIYFGQDKYQAMQNYVKLLEESRAKFAKLYSSLFTDSPDNFDLDKVKAFIPMLNTEDERGAKAKAVLEELVALYEYIQDLENSLNSLTAEIVGQLRDDLMDSLYDGWMRGVDGALKYGEIAGKVLDDLLRKMIYTKFFAGIFDDLSDRIDEINDDTELSEEERITAWGEALQNFGDTYRNASQQAGQFWQTWVSTLQGMGFDTIGEANRNAQSQGIQSISQESADRIDGMLTSVQGSIIDIKDMQGTIRDSAISINENVIIIRNHTGEMAQKLDRIDYNINQMATNGINVN